MGLVVKLFSAAGKPRPKGARAVLPALEKGAKRDLTVQTSQTDIRLEKPALQAFQGVMAWAMHWQNSEMSFTTFGELP
ncbi:hypothetical protein H097_02277 [Pseudomonas sp. FH4]|nr:hypothetical protein H097_02277 [Pseudomonas sp. FH4]GGL35341.1 hypothetical protein GCM10009091_16520 [Pseudomonas brenneri]